MENGKKYLLRCVGLLGRTVRPTTGTDRAMVIGQYLKSYDPEAHKGRGTAEWTADPDQAIHFSSAEEAFACWHQVPASRPVRKDGRPNKPLTAFSVEIAQA